VLLLVVVVRAQEKLRKLQQDSADLQQQMDSILDVKQHLRSAEQRAQLPRVRMPSISHYPGYDACVLTALP